MKRSSRRVGRTLLTGTATAAMILAVLAFAGTMGFAHEDGVGDDPNYPGHGPHAPLTPDLIPPGTWIVGTAHDFDALVDVANGEQGCIVCHDGPTWNHATTAQPGSGGYVTSTTVGTADPQPGAISLKCLDCHDGTVRVDDFGGSAGGLQGEILPTDDGYLGTDLKHHHPVGVVYDDHDAGAQMVPSNQPNHYGTLPSELLVDGKVECTSCHNQHTQAQENNPDNAPGQYSHVHEWGHFVRLEHLCFYCHERYQSDVDQSLPYSQRKVSPYATAHHFPGRGDPWGILRGGANGDQEFACFHCHDVEGDGPYDPGDPHNSPCVECHATWDPIPGSSPSAGSATSHHGFSLERHNPVVEGAVCHPDPDTGLLTGAPYGTYPTPSCGSCHKDVWSTPVFSVDAGGPYEGEVGDTITLTATFILPATPSDGDTLTASWNLGDGTPPSFPTTITYTAGAWDGDLTISHVFPVGTTSGIVTLTDGVNDPVTDSFTVTIIDPAAPTADSWNIDPVTEADFEITFDTAAGGVDGVFTAVKNGTSVAFGIEAVGTIFWFDMEFTTENWGVGSTYFGNINRGAGEMNGIIITSTGDLDTFTGTRN